MIEKRARAKAPEDPDGELPPELVEKARELARELAPLMRALAKH